MKQRLIETLNGVGKPARLRRFADGSEVLVLPYGGRILGLFSPASGENFFWTNPALESHRTAAEFYAGNQWHNSGGERTWLAPEVDFFLPNFPKTDVYHQPRQLDPGNWRVVEEAEGIRLVNRLVHRLSRSKAEVEVEIAKSITPTRNPLRHEPILKELRGVEFAGYTLRTSLEFVGPKPPAAPVGLWALLQMPHGGEMLITTYFKSAPRVFFGTICPHDLESSDRLIRYRMSAGGEHKIGVRAVAACGRIGYRYTARDGRSALVIRNAFIDPSGQYVDVPWDAPQDMGYAVQACNVNSGLGRFSELEHHAPAIGPGAAPGRSEDIAETWAFRGPETEIARIAAALLGVGGTP